MFNNIYDFLIELEPATSVVIGEGVVLLLLQLVQRARKVVSSQKNTVAAFSKNLFSTWLKSAC